MDKLFKYINPKRVLDIGANVGDFSKKIYFRFPKCEIIMIEANPNCKPYLQLLEIPYQLIGVSDKKAACSKIAGCGFDSGKSSPETI